MAGRIHGREAFKFEIRVREDIFGKRDRHAVDIEQVAQVLPARLYQPRRIHEMGTPLERGYYLRAGEQLVELSRSPRMVKVHVRVQQVVGLARPDLLQVLGKARDRNGRACLHKYGSPPAPVIDVPADYKGFKPAPRNRQRYLRKSLDYLFRVQSDLPFFKH